MTMRERVTLGEAVAVARAAHRDTIEDFVAWCAWLGRTVDPDVAALIHAAEDEEPADRGWDRASFFSFYWAHILNWCAIASCAPPPYEDLPEALWLWLHHREVSGRWGPRDEPLHELLKVLLCYGNIGFDGRRLEKTRRLVPCECYVTRGDGPSRGEPSDLDDLDQELADELGYVPERHRCGEPRRRPWRGVGGVG